VFITRAVLHIAVLLTLFSIPLRASMISIVNNCAGNSLCVVEGSDSGIGTIEFTLHILTEGNNVDGLSNQGPGGSGSVTIEEDAFTEGPIRPGFIEFFYDLATTTTLNIGGTVAANFAVAGITGNVPGEVGVPTPYGGELQNFALGVPFAITASASFSVPPAPGPPGSSFTKSVADAGVGFSFLLFDANGNLVTIEDPPSDSGGTVPEPGTLAFLAIGGLCFVCRRAVSIQYCRALSFLRRLCA
jgi:hypothetical protein